MMLYSLQMNFHLLSFQIYCDPPKHTKNSIYNNQLYQLSVDPAFLLMHFLLDGELDFYLKKIDFYLFKEMTGSRHLFLFYLKG